MSHVIRTTMRPDVEITVSDAEYENLLELGLIYGAEPGPDDPSNVGFDLVLIAGQSNAQGANIDWDQRTDPPDSRVWVFEGSGTYSYQITQAVEPLRHQTASGGIGPGLPFARWYATTLPNNRRVLLVPTAVGGTPLAATTGDTWHPQIRGSLYDGAVAQTQAALTAAGANARLTAAIWVQGEQDIGDGVDATTYQQLMDALIGGLRRDLAAPTLPFIVGSMVPETYGGTDIDAVHAATPGRVRYTAFVQGPTGYRRTEAGQSVHYTAAGQRIIGRLMAAAEPTAEANTLPPAAPLPGADLNTVATPPTIVTSYNMPSATNPTPQTASVTTQPGDLLLVATYTSNESGTSGTPTGGTGITWSLVARAPATTTASFCNAFVFKGTATTAETVTISVPTSSTGTTGFVGRIVQFRDHGGVGASAIGASTTTTVDITTTADHSAVMMTLVDWNTVDGASRTWDQSDAGTITEIVYDNYAPSLVGYVGVYNDAGTAGAKTVGLTAPAGQQDAMVAVEILPA